MQLTIVKRAYNVFVTRIFSLYAQRTSVYTPMCDAGIRENNVEIEIRGNRNGEKREKDSD